MVLGEPVYVIWWSKTDIVADSNCFEDGLKLVKLRGEAMQDAAKSAMASVIGLDSEKVQQLCDAANQEVPEAEKVQIANYLCPGNYAVSGGIKGVEVLEAKAKSFKARMTVRLAVAGAFHTSFMEPVMSRLEAEMAATEIRTPRIPVISNVDAQPHANPDTIKKILARQLEPLAEGISNTETNDEAKFFATEWMFKVAEGAIALYIEQLRGIQYISDRGAQQLSIDIEYLSNVLSALSMPIPPVLATFQSCLSTSKDQLKDLLKTDSANQLDLLIANLVCKMQRVNLDS